MRLTKANVPFTMVANEVLANPNISLKAKGLYGYLFSKPEGWQFSSARIIKECKESKPTVLAILKELEANCLLQRKRLKNGRVEYHLTHAVCAVVETPSQESLPGPESKNASEAILHRGKSLPVSNTDNSSNTDKESKKDSGADGAEGPVTAQSPIEKQIAEIIYRFREYNPAYKQLFNRKTQREPVRRLLEQFGFDQLCGMVAYLRISNAAQFAPTITTPSQFESKLGDLKAWADKQRSGRGGKGREIISATT